MRHQLGRHLSTNIHFAVASWLSGQGPENETRLGAKLQKRSQGDPVLKVHLELCTWFGQAELTRQFAFTNQRWTYDDVAAVAEPEGLLIAEAALLQLAYEYLRRWRSEDEPYDAFSQHLRSPVGLGSMIIGLPMQLPTDVPNHPSAVLDVIASHACDANINNACEGYVALLVKMLLGDRAGTRLRESLWGDGPPDLEDCWVRGLRQYFGDPPVE